ncbi:hypothetical protein AKJ16_DCAP25296 [Drosera capensis]
MLPSATKDQTWWVLGIIFDKSVLRLWQKESYLRRQGSWSYQVTCKRIGLIIPAKRSVQRNVRLKRVHHGFKSGETHKEA